MTGPDAADPREQLREGWRQQAGGWVARAAQVREFGMPVAVWMIDAADLQPGRRVLELAAGPGEVGLLAAELVRPGGSMIITDFQQAMLDGAAASALERGLDDVVETRISELEWIDCETASVDAVLCRWGYMFAVDTEAALRETRRVLAPGGRLALAAWERREDNPFSAIPQRAVAEITHLEPVADDVPGSMFSLSDHDRLRSLLEHAGFTDIAIDTVAVQRRHPDFDDCWASTRDISRGFARAADELPPQRREDLRAELRRLVEPHTDAASGEIVLPGLALVAAASA